MGWLWDFAYFCCAAVTYSWGFSRLVSFFFLECFVCSWKFIFNIYFTVLLVLGEKIFQLIKLFWEVHLRYFWICWRWVFFFNLFYFLLLFIHRFLSLFTKWAVRWERNLWMTLTGRIFFSEFLWFLFLNRTKKLIYSYQNLIKIFLFGFSLNPHTPQFYCARL